MPLSLPSNMVKRIADRYDMSLDEILVSSDNVQEVLKTVEKVARVTLDFYKMLNFTRYIGRKEAMEELLSVLSKVVYVDKSEEDILVAMNMVFHQVRSLGINRYMTNGVYKFRFTLNEDYTETNKFIYDKDIDTIARAYPDDDDPELSFIRINSSDLGETLRACAQLCSGKHVEIASFIGNAISTY
jgi:hypothetical protein